MLCVSNFSMKRALGDVILQRKSWVALGEKLKAATIVTSSSWHLDRVYGRRRRRRRPVSELVFEYTW